jgi:hypothetical protein
VSPASLNLGFLTVLQEANGFLGGYLVTNSWGRPLEFRLSTAVEPSRVQQILYGPTLRPYICADLIGKALVEKTSTHVQIIVTDCQSALELHRLIRIPVIWLPQSGLAPSEPPGSEALVKTPSGDVFCHPQFGTDKPTIRRLIEHLTEVLDLSEPFARIRKAIAESRKLGFTASGSTPSNSLRNAS